MADHLFPANGAGAVTLQLVDSISGAPLRSWRLVSEPVIRIGRGEHNHVVVHDQQVSRVHAEINYENGDWVLVNLGRNGTVLHGKAVSRATLANSDRFRLGNAGPWLKFLDHAEEVAAETTIMARPLIEAAPEPKIDQQRKDQQVAESVDSDYFRELRKVSQQLKSKV